MEKTEFELDLRKLGNVVSSMRIEQKITQEVLATNCDLDVRSIQRIEKGKQNISFAIVFSLAKGLKIPPHELVILSYKD